jgi:hypothetical protein
MNRCSRYSSEIGWLCRGGGGGMEGGRGQKPQEINICFARFLHSPIKTDEQ